MVYIVYGLLLLVYWRCPKYLKVVAFVINFFVADPVPFIDEIVMIAGLLAKDQPKGD